MKNNVPTFEEHLNEANNWRKSMRLPKLGDENRIAAEKLTAMIAKNPGVTDSEVKVFINSNKAVLKGYDKPMHYKNYENILNYLVVSDRIFMIRAGNKLLYYLKGQKPSKEVLDLMDLTKQ